MNKLQPLGALINISKSSDEQLKIVKIADKYKTYCSCPTQIYKDDDTELPESVFGPRIFWEKFNKPKILCINEQIKDEQDAKKQEMFAFDKAIKDWNEKCELIMDLFED